MTTRTFRSPSPDTPGQTRIHPLISAQNIAKSGRIEPNLDKSGLPTVLFTGTGGAFAHFAREIPRTPPIPPRATWIR